MKKLEGGRENIHQEGQVVIRPQNVWTEDVHKFLNFLHESGFKQVPYPYGFDGVYEEVSYVEGDVYNDLLPAVVQSDEALISLAKMVREFHDIGELYIRELTGDERWMLPVRKPIETMCHGDLAPYNTAIKGCEAVGLIDFDTLHPGPRIWDVAYALYRWVPLMSEENPESFGSHEDKKRRLVLFLNTYGEDLSMRDDSIKWVIKRIEYLMDFMKEEAAKGDESFKKAIKDGHLETYEKDLIYIMNKWLKE